MGSELFDALRSEARGPLGLLAEAYRRWLLALPPGDLRRSSPWGVAQWPLPLALEEDPAWARWAAERRSAEAEAGDWRPSARARSQRRGWHGQGRWCH